MTSIPPLPPEAPAADATFVPPPAPVVAAPFEQLGLAAPVLANLARLGYHQMTPIQAASLPVALAGNDLIAQAKTGSGKTAAFGLGLLSHLDVNRLEVQALVLCPTRELADQVATEIRRLARTLPNVKLVTLCGGTPTAPQSATLSFGAHIAVGTPGRILKHLEQGTLELSSLENENLRPIEQINVSREIAAILASLEIEIKERGIEVHQTNDPLIIGINPDDFDKLMRNLLENAIKYNKEHGEIFIRVSAKDKVISVRDTGIGISEEDKTRIFERFYRVDKARSRENGGTGLGLAIVKYICNYYDYGIDVDSALGHGTTFTVHVK